MSTLSGNAGLNFSITESNTTNVAGAVTQVYSIDTTVGDISLSTSDVVYAMYGQVGANSYQLDLNSINNVSGAGTGIDVKVVRNNAGDLNRAKFVVVYNADTSKTITIAKGATSSFITATDQITLQPKQGVGLAYGNPQTVGATSSVISIVGSAGSTNHYVYILGN